MKTTMMAFAVLAAVSGGAGAADSDFYAGVGVGTVRAEGEHITAPLIRSGQRLKDNAGTADFFVGYHVNPWASVEIGYADLGTLGDRYAVAPTVSIATNPNLVDRERIEPTRIAFDLLLEHALSDQFGVYGLLGYASVDLDRKTSGRFASYVGDLVGPDTARLPSGHESGARYGLGVRYAFDKSWSSRLQWVRDDLDHYTMDNLRLSMEARF